MKSRAFIFFILVFLNLANLSGQNIQHFLFNENYDSTYYDKLNHLLTVKTFVGRKFSEFSVSDNNVNKSLLYNSNPESTLGLGLSYKWLGVNLGFGFKNNADSLYGKTSRLDLQTQVYLRKLTLNIYTSLYNGFYLENSHEMLKGYSIDSYYQRGDIKNLTIGLNTYYVFNSSRYSNRATFIQNEWQKKTAGSLLAGANLFYNYIFADSSLIPNQLIDTLFLDGHHYTASGYLAFGGDLGYTVSFVLKQHWFFDFTILGGLTYGISSFNDVETGEQSAVKIGLNLLNRFGVGYNSERLYVGLNYTNMQANTPLPLPKIGYGFGIGQIRFLIAYRFKLPEHNNYLPSWFPAAL